MSKYHASKSDNQSPSVSEQGRQQGNQNSSVGASFHGHPHGNAAMQEHVLQHVEHTEGASAVDNTPRPNTPLTKSGAMVRRDMNTKAMETLLERGRNVSPRLEDGPESMANLLSNSVAWLDANEAELIVLSPTHDSHTREGVGPSQVAYFDTRTTHQEVGADYNDAKDERGIATDNSGIAIKSSGILGTMSTDGQTMTIVDPCMKSENSLMATLIHEVQHDADQHGKDQPWSMKASEEMKGDIHTAPAWVYNRYQSEFRAYWLQVADSEYSTFGTSESTEVEQFEVTAVNMGDDFTVGTDDDKRQTVQTALQNERQSKIFKHLLGTLQPDDVYLDRNGWRQSYAYLPHYYVFDPNFKAMVDSYTHPVAGNFINSPRIQQLSSCLEVAPHMWRDASELLNDLDKAYLMDQEQSAPFWAQLRDAISEQEVLEFEGYLRSGEFTSAIT